MPTAKPAPKTRNTKKFVRNLTRSYVAFRIGGREGRRIELNPRGFRADLASVDKEELPKLEDVDVLYEIITDAEAKKIITKQTQNQQAFHPAVATLRNNKGERYETGPQIATEEEAQGVTVAHIEVDGKNVKVDRAELKYVDGPREVARPGSVKGAADAIARQKDIEGPEAGGVKSVKMAPVERKA